MKVAGKTGADEHQRFMRIALQMAERGLAAGGAPVGACLVREGVVVSKAQNAVVADLDVTAHAEVVVIREACRALQSLQLANCTLYVSVEPCAMCLAASHYAGISEIVFAAGIDAMQALTGNELPASPAQSGATTDSPRLTGGVLQDESLRLLQSWTPAK